LNLRPPGYEPGELPDCSTPRRGSKDSIIAVPWWTWIALGAFALALVAVAIFAVATYGRVKRMTAAGERLAARLEELSAQGEKLERRAEHAGKRAEEVEREIARVQGSLDRLGVLVCALSDARQGVTRLREAYLRK
jgi:hypothetical protein